MDELRHVELTHMLIRESMPAQVQCDDAVLKRKFLQLVMPLRGLSAKPVNKNKSPLGMIGRDVNCRKPHRRSSPVDQRICRNAHFVAIQVEIDVHDEGSLHEAETNVNFEKQKPAPENPDAG